MRRILCLRFPEWPLQRLIAARRELRARPVIIFRRTAHGDDFVQFASASAQEQGVRGGMPLAEAAACFREEASVSISMADPDTDLLWLARMSAWCERYSPLVGWKTISALPPSTHLAEALFLDIQGIGPLFGGEDALAQDLLGEMKKRGFSPRLGIADTVGAAWAVTFQAREVTVVQREDLPIALAPLPVAALRLEGEQLDKLRQLGVTTIEQLNQLPRAGLQARFGTALLLRIDQALGAAEEVIEPHKPAPEFYAEWALEIPTQRRDEVEIILTHLVKQMVGQLLQRQRGAMQLVGRLDAAGVRPVWFSAGLYRPTAATRHLLELVLLQIERLQLPEPIGRISLSAPLTAALKASQRCLFQDEFHDASAMSHLLDRLSSRLGPAAVLQVRPRSDPLPERTVELHPVLQNRKKSVAPIGWRSLTYRPLVLLPSPIKLPITTAVMPDGPPLRFEYEQRTYVVARHWGPERIESGWWRQRGARRDYYRVETTIGTRFWLFRELQHGEWFLHGVFE
jgi:protein ImuB